ncbi:reverse transcriptase family protein [Oceanomicrobium pacificus]|uniref:RNA-directed DNA polymerase n=1 Tax=Oceanomicrobium pacificus TaxID=2692916 RepID=A0A6B0TN09_9RHOB|nr:reverse transcriptase family protein [Oceanomicrobium pacificus]MXU65917.1 RNA-directed DNA polymerase [Oceanomicrobium pacificus]
MTGWSRRNPWSPTAFMQACRREGEVETIAEPALGIARRIKAQGPDLPVLFSLEHLAATVDVPIGLLLSYVDREKDPYRVFSISKKRGPKSEASNRRTICVPEPLLSKTQCWIAAQILNNCKPHSSSTAYAPGSSLVNAVKEHCGARWLLKVDVKNFFESINELMVFETFSSLGYPRPLCFQMARICTRVFGTAQFEVSKARLGVLPQGAPSSPMLANLAVNELDEAISEIAIRRGWIYTRYADDLAFSTKRESSRHEAKELIFSIVDEIRSFGLSPNNRKTTISPPGARKVLLGLNVDTSRPRLTRRFKNNLETHVYAITNPSIGIKKHSEARQFRSEQSMIKHIAGLIAYARSIEPEYADKLYRRLTADAIST